MCCSSSACGLFKVITFTPIVLSLLIDGSHRTALYLECLLKDAMKPELDSLRLTIFDTPDIYLNLVRLSGSVWWLRDMFVNIPIPPQGLFLAVSSANFGDLGHMHLDISCFISEEENGSIQTEINLNRKLESGTAAPELKISFELYPRINSGKEEDDLGVNEIHSFECHAIKVKGLKLYGDLSLKIFRMTQSQEDIQASIAAYTQAINCLSLDDPSLQSFVEDLGIAYSKSYERFGGITDLGEAINERHMVLGSTSEGSDENLQCQLNNLGISLQHPYERTGFMTDVAESTRALEILVQLAAGGHPDLSGWLNNLARSFVHRFEKTGALADISESIQLQQLALQLTPEGHSALPTMLNNLGSSFTCRFEETGDLADNLQSIQLRRRALQLAPQGHLELPGMFNNLGNSYFRRFERTGDLADISQAIRFQQQAVELTPEGHSDLPSRFNNLGSSFIRQFERTGDLADISKAIQLLQRALQLTPEGYPGLPSMLNNFGGSLTRRFERTGDLTDISQAIQHQQRALQLTPEGHSNLPRWLSNLGYSFSCRFERIGDLADILESIQLQQRALQLTADGHSALPIRLHNLGISFTHCFKGTGDLDDILKSIQLLQQAIQLTPEGHSDLPRRLNNLGTSFTYHFERTGDLADISQSIQLQLRAVQLTPERHSELPGMLNHLGNSFTRRFERTGDLADISESILLQRRAIQLTPEGHSYLPSMLNNLGGSLTRRFQRTGDLGDILLAIQHQQRALQLTPEGHSDIPSWLNNLGGSLIRRFERTGDVEDVIQAIQLQQRAVELTPKGHSDLPSRFNNLGGSYTHRFEKTADLADISQAIELQQQAVQLTPEGHSELSSRLSNLASSYLYHFHVSNEQTSYTSALTLFRQAALPPNNSLSHILKAAKQWAGLAPSKSEQLNAHGRVIQVLTLVTGLENTLERRHNLLIDSSELSTAAAAAALSANRPDKALEWLEQGRCIVWNQLNQLRTPLEDLRIHHPKFADQLFILSQRLENFGSRSDLRHTNVELSMVTRMSLEDEAYNHLKLARERDELLATIQSQAGFESFLKPRKCSDLMSSLSNDGSVVIINANEKRCDALALVAGLDEPIHIPLEQIPYQRAENLANLLHNHLLRLQLRNRYDSEETEGYLRGMRNEKLSFQLLDLLKTIWTDLVEPILQSLSISTPKDENQLPRIWWCPTGPFAFLPIHAAGIYKDGKGVPGSCLTDFAISSYIPNLTALDRLRSRTCTTDATDNGVLLISQPDTPGLTRLPCTEEEVRRISEILKTQGIQSEEHKSKDATIALMEKYLESFSCVHLACHASQNINKPLESAIHLYDGPLKLTEIMKKNLLNAELAFMSACQTSTGHEKLPEEAVHLAAGMLAAEYRSVVATMWSISDKHAPLVAERFYEHLLSRNLSEGRSSLDGSEAARALHVAMRHLRERLDELSPMSEDAKLLAWIPYVHFGI